LKGIIEPVATSSTLRKDDKDRSFFLQFPPQIGKRMGPPILPPHWQSVEHDCRKVLVTLL